MTDAPDRNSQRANTRDDIFANTLGHPGLFSFNETVVSVFPDMIRRSVPGYATVIGMTGLLAARHARSGTRIYDLGCSLGASLMSAAHQLASSNYTLVGIDNSPAMLARAREILAREAPDTPYELIEGDITTTAIENASVVIMNYTLQFVPLAQRGALLRRIRAAMQPGDALILSEKLAFEEPAINGLMINLHEDFKRAQGYSDLEVAKKRQALENVLIPESREAHIQRIRDCGFAHCDFWFQCFNFGSLVAIA